MAAILHLLSRGADAQTCRLHEMLTVEMGRGFDCETLTIGDGGDFRNLAVAVLGIRGRRPDLVYAWGIRSLAAAVLAGHRKILFSPDRFLGPRSLGWVRSMMGDRPGVHMICPTMAQQRSAVTRGIDFRRCHVIRPGVDFGRLRRRDPKLREQLGLSDTDYVLLAPGESTIPSGHDQAIWAAGILNVLDAGYKLLLWGRGPRTVFAIELARRLRQTEMLKLAEPRLGAIWGRAVDFEELLPAADACLIAAGGSIPTLPVLTTMAAGVPIVSTVTYLLAEQLEDRHTALMVPKRSPRALAQRVLDLREDDTLRWKIADTARAEAFEFFSMTKMLEAYRQAIQQVLAGNAVSVG